MANGTLIHYAYCGMSVPILESNDLNDLRRKAAAVIRRRRKNWPVTTLKQGIEWEIESNDDDFMVSDFCGQLVLTPPTDEQDECDFEEDDYDL